MVEMPLPLTIEEASVSLRCGELTAVRMVQALLRHADRVDARLGAYLTRFDEAALAAAAQCDAELAAGRDCGPLHGIPIALKDVIAAREGETTAQSQVLDRAWGANRDAVVVARLRAAGAVIMGKTTTMEFAIGMPDERIPFPIPLNPWNMACWPGGSSSGTANGVASGLFLAGLGSDTGGSIRLPAALCGVTGLAPTYGLVPKSGVVPLGFSLDRVGPIARSAWDCAAILNALAGHDPSDDASARRPRTDYLHDIEKSLDGLRIGFVCGPLIDAASDDVRRAYQAALQLTGGLGADLREIALPLYDETSAVMVLTMAAEAFAYHHNDFRSRWADYTPGTRETVGWGAFVSGADYVQAQRVRRVSQRRIHALFDEVDLIICPTSTAGAPALADMLGEARTRAMAHWHVTYWSTLGLPVLALPIGFDMGGLPLGIQLIGKPFDEQTVLRAGYAYQNVTDWHLRLPPLAANKSGSHR